MKFTLFMSLLLLEVVRFGGRARLCKVRSKIPLKKKCNKIIKVTTKVIN